MFIVTQDRDEIIQKTQPLFTVPAIYNGKVYGINLFHASCLLGAFDSVSEAIAEMNRIESCADEIYFVDGYCTGGEDAEIVQELLSILKENEDCDYA